MRTPNAYVTQRQIVTLEPGQRLAIDDTLGQRLLSLAPPRRNPVVGRLDGRAEIDLRVQQFPLAPGDYWIKLGLDCAGVEIDASIESCAGEWDEETHGEGLQK